MRARGQPRVLISRTSRANWTTSRLLGGVSKAASLRAIHRRFDGSQHLCANRGVLGPSPGLAIPEGLQTPVFGHSRRRTPNRPRRSRGAFSGLFKQTSNVGAAMHVGRPFPYDQQGEAGPLPVLVHGDMDGSDRSLRRCFSRRARCRGGRPRGFLPPVAPRRARRPASASVGPRGSNACHARTRVRRRALAEHPATRPG
jgi:hypothetical protein